MRYLPILFLIFLSSCSFFDYKLVRFERCERINDVIYCENETIDTTYYPSCSIYDTRHSCK
jgi:hypothetical protein